MAWAVKDFIFVFTRIINAWLILKGYIYNRSEGMRKVQAAFSGNFQDGFFQWQKVTQQLIENIIESFENLDEAVQKSRTNGSGGGGSGQGSQTGGGGGKSGSSSSCSSSTRMNSVDLSNFLWENKEVTMRASSNKGGSVTPAVGGGGGGMTGGEERSGETTIFEREMSHFMERSGGGGEQGRGSAGGGGGSSNLTTPIYNEAERDELETYYKTGLYQSMKRRERGGGNGGGGGVNRPAVTGGGGGVPEEDYHQSIDQIESQKENNPGQLNIPDELDLIDKLDLETNLRRYEQEAEGNIQYLLHRVVDINETPYFFHAHFMKNYVSRRGDLSRWFNDDNFMIILVSRL